jgi:hypothetical protein
MFVYIVRGAVKKDWKLRFQYPSIDRLLDCAAEREPSRDESLVERSEEFNAILRHIRIGGTWKMTRSCRLRQSDRVLCAHLGRERRARLRFLDVGASDGLTTLETVRLLERELGPVEAVLADRYLYLDRKSWGPVSEYIACDGKLALVRCGRIGLPAGDISGVITPRLTSWYRKCRAFRRRMRMNARIPLVNPAVAAHGGIHLLEMDILHPAGEVRDSMDVIRASNILLSPYFSESEIGAGVDALAGCLREGGHLLVSRNFTSECGEIERGSLWHKKGGSLSHIVDFGGGSEIRKLVDSRSAIEVGSRKPEPKMEILSG